jgi:hypothetical protein
MYPISEHPKGYSMQMHHQVMYMQMPFKDVMLARIKISMLLLESKKLHLHNPLQLLLALITSSVIITDIQRADILLLVLHQFIAAILHPLMLDV